MNDDVGSLDLNIYLKNSHFSLKNPIHIFITLRQLQHQWVRFWIFHTLHSAK